jgi:putative transposase
MILSPKSLYRGHRFPAEVIAHAVWLYFRFPLSLRMVEDLLAARGIVVSHETVRRWAEKFGRDFAKAIRLRAPQFGDKWHLDEVVVSPSTVRSIGFGALSTRTALSSTLWFRAAATSAPLKGFCVSSFASRPARLAS